MAYTIEGRKSGVVRFEPFKSGVIQTESETLPSKVTSNPLEDGSNANDHVINESGVFNIAGTLVGGDADVQALKRMRKNSDIMTYTGRMRVENLLFTSLQFGVKGDNADGFSFTASFQQVQITAPELMDVGKVPMMSSQDKGKSPNPQAAKTTTAGKQQAQTCTISTNAYTQYVQQYNTQTSKPQPSPANPAYTGAAP